MRLRGCVDYADNKRSASLASVGHFGGSLIDQFSNLDGIAGRILGCYEHGPTFFVREILDGIVAKPGGDYIHGGYRHRQALQQSRVKYHGLPGPPLVRADHES